MKRSFNLQVVAPAIAVIMSLAGLVYAQTGSGPIENQNNVRETITTDGASSANVKAAFTVKSPKAKALFGKEKRSDTISVEKTQTSGEDPQALAKKLANPISSLISVPFQNNFDFGMGPDKHGFRYTMNFQPVIPVALNKKWNLISRTIVPVIAQHNVASTGSQFGLGDIFQSFFFSPNKSEPFVWGFGPALLIPTATNSVLGTQKFSIGPTLVVLKQQKQWTVGMLSNHVWSVAGKGSRANVSSTFIQPFLSYTTKKAWTFTANTESTYDWRTKSWGVPIHLQAAKLVKFGRQPVSVGGALRCWATSPAGGPHWCGLRFIFTPLFPKK